MGKSHFRKGDECIAVYESLDYGLNGLDYYLGTPVFCFGIFSEIGK